MLTAKIFDIQSFSTHDGPGCRTVVFFKGCPLKCRWCANPEGMYPYQEIMWRESKCNGCGRCAAACAKDALIYIDGKIQRQRSKCRSCETFACAASCFSDALIPSSKTYTVSELMDVLRRDREFWGEQGGVTFSGGEPFAQFKFLEQVVRGCITEYMDTAIETSAYAKTFDFVRVMQWLDFVFIDIKHMNDAKHKAATGLGNGLILNNISMLAMQQQHPRIVIRIPVVPGYNDDEQNMMETAKFMKANKLSEINLLPFHNLGESKWRQLGLPYFYEGKPGIAAENLNRLAKIFEAQGIKCYCGATEW
ncbi:MAG: glycyl-radical enzyme activating protein [Negativicutes bacterium]|jgi:pyruvate formate lyase activating enzyme